MSGLAEHIRQLTEGIEMSALEQVRNSKNPTQLELAVMWYGDEQTCDAEQLADAEQAAKELHALQERVKELEAAHNRIIEMCIYEGQVISMCSCGKPNGIPAVVSCARTAVSA